MMIFLYHFNIFLSMILCQNVRYFMQEYCIFIHCLWCVLCKNLYGIALFLCVEWVKYCGKVWGKLSDLWLKCDVNLSVWRVVFVWILYNFICFYVVFCVLFWVWSSDIFNAWIVLECAYLWRLWWYNRDRNVIQIWCNCTWFSVLIYVHLC